MKMEQMLLKPLHVFWNVCNTAQSLRLTQRASVDGLMERVCNIHTTDS